MKKTTAQSLLPLLDTGSSEIRLEISLRPEKVSTEDRISNPFLIINESYPLSRIIGGQFVSGSGSIIKKVFLAIQKDECHNLNKTHRPVTNSDIDFLWQESFSYHQEENQDSFIFFPSQSGKNQQLLPYQPLFYCCHTRKFFHPPCPVCGNQLEQYYDDEAMTFAGLGSYSNTLKRYLHCPECFSNRVDFTFYIHERHSSDPPTLQDRWDLIRDFGRLIESDFSKETLPCLSCQQVLECYGTGKEAVNRITPLSFYNFYLFFHSAPSLHPLDFLALTSGASPEEISGRLKADGEYGRLDSLQDYFPKGSSDFTFFYKNHETWPVEVLFLKISFLSQLFSAVTPLLDKQNYSDLCLPLDQFWLKVGEYDRHLPFCWNFTAMPIGPGFIIDAAGSKNLKVPVAGMLHTMGHIWFSVLFFSKNNDFKNIQDSLVGILDEKSLDDFTNLEQKITSGQIPSLKPKNILWDPLAAVNVDCLQPFLPRALKLGWDLFRVAYNLETGWSTDQFIKEIDSFAEDLKANLLQTGAHIPVPVPSSAQISEDAAIGEILHHILERWQDDATSPSTLLAEDSDQPPIITRDANSETGEVSSESPGVFEKAAEVEETRIMQRQDTDKKTPQTPEKPGNSEEIMETQILQPDQPVPGVPQPHPDPDTSHHQAEEIERTVIITGSTASRLTSSASFPASSTATDKFAAERRERKQEKTDKSLDKEKSLNEDLSATIIISPEELAKLRRKH